MTAVELLKDMVEQHCQSVQKDGVELYSSGALSVNRDVFFYLVDAGVAEFVGEGYGRQWTIKFKSTHNRDYQKRTEE
jgi:hypothetical protein